MLQRCSYKIFLTYVNILLAQEVANMLTLTLHTVVHLTPRSNTLDIIFRFLEADYNNA